MKKAFQASGRPLKTLEDKAAMIFLEYRFSMPYCRQFFPLWIRDDLKILPREDEAISQELRRFFRRVS
jgi:Rad3-related DNA helicase